MEVLTLFRVICGPRWRLFDLILYPAGELFILGRGVYTMFAPKSQTFAGASYFFTFYTTVATGALGRLWVLRNQKALEEFFRVSRRRVSALEILIGIAYILMFIWEAYYNVNAARNYPVDVAIKDVVLDYLFGFRFLWICFILTLYFKDVNFQLKYRYSEGDLRSFRRSCTLLESVNLQLNGLHDYILYTAFGVLINLGSTALFSKCDVEINMATWVSHESIPFTILIALGEQASNLMYAKRVQLRRTWPKIRGVVELYAANGHQNALGLRWLASSENMNFSSALPLLSSIIVYATLILTTPMFLEAGDHDVFCENADSSGQGALPTEKVPRLNSSLV